MCSVSESGLNESRTHHPADFPGVFKFNVTVLGETLVHDTDVHVICRIEEQQNLGCMFICDPLNNECQELMVHSKGRMLGFQMLDCSSSCHCQVKYSRQRRQHLAWTTHSVREWIDGNWTKAALAVCFGPVL